MAQAGTRLATIWKPITDHQGRHIWIYFDAGDGALEFFNGEMCSIEIMPKCSSQRFGLPSFALF